jgi:stage II sporulation protein D
LPSLIPLCCLLLLPLLLPLPVALLPETLAQSNPNLPTAHPPLPPAASREPVEIPAPPFVRVGLATDLESLTLPCCDGEITTRLGEEVVAVLSPLRIAPAAEAGPGAYRLQVAALKDEVQAQQLAATLAEQFGGPAEARFDAAADLYKVRLGRYADRTAADAARDRLRRAGFDATWVVSEGGNLSGLDEGGGGLRVTQGERTVIVPGRWLTVEASEGGGIRYQGRRYRGTLRVYLNDRGSLNLINELTLDDYLRGVVPKEMGPLLYNELEALKAQAVAARSYTLFHLGEWVREGFDICATPRCQVYGGMEHEHPVTDRAIAETAGEVLVYDGRTADARYTATCGGHTENVETVFPRVLDEPYLKGVPCLEGGFTTLAGDLPAGVPFPDGLTGRLLPPPEGQETASPEVQLEARLRRLAGLAGVPAPPPDALDSLERREVQRFVASLFDLVLDARLFVAREDLAYLLEQAPPGWGEDELRQAAYLLRHDLLRSIDGGEETLTPPEAERLLLGLAEMLYVVRREDARFRGLEGGILSALVQGEERAFPLPSELAVFRRHGDAHRSHPLKLLIGDRLHLYLRGDRLLAVVQEVEEEGVAFDRTAKYRSWRRFRSDAQLAAAVRQRYPEIDFRGFEVLGRGVSGRVGKVRLLGAGGRTAEVEGLAVRWTFDLPETLFTAQRLTPPDGTPGWLFRGKGWGHGVGLCQVGAFGMAQRRHGYREILGHYYPGTAIGRLQYTPRTP